jgi:hypothetical protein
MYANKLEKIWEKDKLELILFFLFVINKKLE